MHLIAGVLLFGSIALIADSLHMTVHAGARLLAALAYRYARRHATDARFTFGTNKLRHLAGFTSAIVLAMIALLNRVGGADPPACSGAHRISEADRLPWGWRWTSPVPGCWVGVATHPHHGHMLHTPEHHGHSPATAHNDSNMRATVVYMVADAAVSVLVIIGLLLARGFGWLWMDPLAGIIGASVIAGWPKPDEPEP
jgi:Co/Zn/Cd efflux system component